MNRRSDHNVTAGIPRTSDRTRFSPYQGAQRFTKIKSVVAIDDADVMSGQQQQSIPATDQLFGKWRQQIGAARIAWDKLTEDELLKSEGREQKLAGLVQQRYAVTRDEADRQIKSFFQKYTF